MGTATDGTWWLAGRATHADPLFFGTRMAHGSWLEAGRLPAGIKWAAPGATGRIGYQDDQYLYGRAVDLARALSRLDESLAQDGHRVRRDKCSLWNPAMDLPEIANQTSADDTRQALAELAREVTVCKGGIDMLGSVARGDLSARVQASGIGPQAMQKRATKAHMLVDRVIAFSRESGCPKRVHMAWTLLARAAAAALTVRCTPGAAGNVGDHVEGAGAAHPWRSLRAPGWRVG